MRILVFGLLLLSASAFAKPDVTPQCIHANCPLGKVKTLQALSARGNVEASFALGHIFLNRDSGIQTNYEMSFYYFERAARYRFWPAVRQTAGMLARGIGVEQNLAEARVLMRKAVNKKVYKAAEEYAVLVFSDPAASEEEKAYALEKLEERVAAGTSYLANYALAYLYIEGKHVTQDLDRARELLAFPAAGGYADSAQLLMDLGSDSTDLAAVIEQRTIAVSPFNPDIEVIHVKGLSYDLTSITEAVMDQLRLTHGQTGSRIKGNGCTRNMPNCVIIDGSRSGNSVAALELDVK